MGKKEEVHPSFGLAVLHRVTGRTRLFASALQQHDTYITLSIHRSAITHELGRDWRYPREELIEVAFSPAQFAQLLTTMNVSEGAPCTIQRYNGEHVPPVPENQGIETEKISESFSQNLEDLSTQLRAYKQSVNETLAKKHVNLSDRKSISGIFDKVYNMVVSNLPFLVEQYERATENIKTAAMAEVDAMMTMAVQKLGMEKLEELKKLSSSKTKSLPNPDYTEGGTR